MRYLSFLCLLALGSCLYNSEPQPVQASIYDVYLAGIVQIDEENNHQMTAAYWKNDQKFELPGGGSESNANVIQVSGDDIYVAGTMSDAEHGNIPVVWKNGEIMLLTFPDSVAYTRSGVTCLAVEEGNVYLGGYTYHVDSYSIYHFTAFVSKNGQMMKLSSALDKQATSISISGQDVYVGARNGYWKNGGFVEALDNPNVILNSILVSKENIFQAGTKFSHVEEATYWKNDVSYILPHSNLYDWSRATSIASSGDDVYVVGYVLKSGFQESMIAYWKNGRLEKLLGPPTSNEPSLVVFGNDVFIAGNIRSTFSYHGAYWVNGKQTDLPDNQLIYSIFVKRK